jgi:hypothetical protein
VTIRLFLYLLWCTFALWGCSLLNRRAASTSKPTTPNTETTSPAKWNTVWSSTYKGKADGVEDVIIELASDGEKYKGTMRYVSSNEVFDLDGATRTDPRKLTQMTNEDELVGDIIMGESSGGFTVLTPAGKRTITPQDVSYVQLKESKNNQLTGILDCVFVGSTLLVNWQNVEGNVGSHIHLKNSTNTYKQLNTDVWVRSYQGKMGKDEVMLCLEHNQKNKITIGGVSKLTKRTLSALALNTEFDETKRTLTAKLFNADGEGIGTLTATLGANFDMLAQSFTETRSKNVYVPKLNQTSALGITTFAYTDFNNTMVYQLPAIKGDSTYNQLIKSLMAGFRIRHQNYVDSIKRTNDKILHPKHRAAFRSYIYPNYSMITDSLISFNALFSSTFGSYETFSITYHRTQKKWIDPRKMFDQDKLYKTYIRDYIEKDLKTREYYNDETFREWMKSMTFDYITVTPFGLLFSTDFNGLFGQQEVLIPFADIQPFLVPNNPLKYLYTNP